MSECIFCKMVAGEIQPEVVYEDAHTLAFRDLHPQAPTHLLVIPKVHVATLNDLDDFSLSGNLLSAVRVVAQQAGLAESGYRTVINCNRDGGQEVYHLHVHVLGGRKLSWPPG
jgi:histidine triad (HIT) family protein